MLASDPKVRRSGIGGSDVAKIAGLSRWGNAVDVWLEKTGRTASELFEEGREPPHLYWGKRLEPVVISEYHRRTGNPVVFRSIDGDLVWLGSWPDMERGEAEEIMNSTLRHPEHEFMMGHLDGLGLNDEGGWLLIEGKTGAVWAAQDWDDSNFTANLPDEHVCQTSWYHGLLLAEGIETVTAHVPALLGGNDFRIGEVQPRPSFIEKLQAISLRFWRQHVEADVVPDIPDGKEGARVLAALFPEEEGGVIEANATTRYLARHLHEADVEYRRAKEELESAKNALKAVLQDDRKIQGDGWKILWYLVTPKPKTSWDHVASGLRRHVEEAIVTGKGLGEGDRVEALQAFRERLATVVELHTVEPEPYRVFRYYHLDRIEAPADPPAEAIAAP